ncbi:bifunctional 5,10-methylenetetrahydrofolate dehydrogenase/5,10-methenyltetrahydrofolate cyclohydrolase [Wolbachia endosymbiont of Howardula sp.]|uniref:bifunctional 5,10-methylenetetrahydrofolate dehydrogenase/5,10-methenyltetrahydrofolate cyclohydrolase n=1 Tax=Wolbachia endosymbiont of Howardula sp. TaxID=2916816 RepID=UPI00217D7943|nr:tetrahydrofolate dehydrogenase/cyclohydrolase catalytic domain-containing protein [Wolbachia endosymbiont of Howardula sp.]UWI82996.1 bifunctional methylenetetrahydrofolate dehydrogenase/methenyltetrahydrofolate cyclohydrolase [Wolbachia endosymbiont of Howardula sp.]
MSAVIIDGNKISKILYESLSQRISQLYREYHIIPCLRVILVGNHPASQLYVRNKQKCAESIGIQSEVILLSSKTSEDQLIDKINEFNQDHSVHGILVQLPLHKNINLSKIMNMINIEKDVDGFHNENIGKLVKGDKTSLISCTPKGVLYLLKSIEHTLSGKHAVILGRSNIVGKPMFHLLLQENCTVTMLHSKSNNLSQYCAQADILVVAVGIPSFVQSHWIKQGAIVIDVGINYVINAQGQRKIIGDVDFEPIKGKALAITPVPGGVGPMTIASLMVNVFIAACIQNRIDICMI